MDEEGWDVSFSDSVCLVHYCNYCFKRFANYFVVWFGVCCYDLTSKILSRKMTFHVHCYILSCQCSLLGNIERLDRTNVSLTSIGECYFLAY
jgi:hypothetical protein